MSKAEMEFAAEHAQKLGDLISRSALELKPCPFCGGEAEIGYKKSCYNHWKPEGFFPRCKDTKCLGRGYRKYHTERAASEAWNRRADDAD